MQQFSIEKMHVKISTIWQPFYSGLNITQIWRDEGSFILAIVNDRRCKQYALFDAISVDLTQCKIEIISVKIK